MGTAAFVVSETAPKGTLFRTADKRQAEQLRHNSTQKNLKYHLLFHSRDDIINTDTNTFIER